MEKTMLKIQELIVEDIEMVFYENVNNADQFRITSIGGEAVQEEAVWLVVLDVNLGDLRVYGRVFTEIDDSNYIGKLKVFYCKKKKGLFGKESLKTINSVIRAFHKDGLASGEEKKVSLKEMMK